MKGSTPYTKKPGLVVLALLLISSGLYASWQDQTVEFQFKGQAYNVTVQPVVQSVGTENGGTDILLNVADQSPLNISTGLPGENLFPLVNLCPSGHRFAVSWFQYQPDNIQLCYYDSLTGVSRLLPLKGFKSAVPLAVSYFDGQPLLLLFQGNNSDNTDIFFYHLETGEVRNITQSPDSDQEAVIEDEENRVFIETMSLYHHKRYRLKKASLRVKQTKEVEIHRDRPGPAASIQPVGINTIVGYGDSITWGTIRMNIEDPEDYYHPEQAFLFQLQGMLNSEYGSVNTINRGYPGNRTFEGVQRVDQAFQGVNAYICLVMFGTNDVPRRAFDVDTSILNLHFILTRLKIKYRMYPIVSTIPPQKDEENRAPGIQYFVEQTEAYNTKLMTVCNLLGVPYVDSYAAFFDGTYYWEDLLESYRGNHPSPLGHQVMAGLFKEEVLDVPPIAPRDIEVSDTDGVIRWEANEEFDFSQYRIQFGYSANALNKSVTTTNTYFRLVSFPLAAPYSSTLYFRIQGVDQEGNRGVFSRIYKVDLD